MYIEYAVIDGILHVRHDPHKDFVPMTAQHITSYAKERERELSAALDEIERLREAHPRAYKLMAKGKPFIVIAVDEPYFSEAYDLIREHEIQKGAWTDEDQRLYEDTTNTLKGGA